MYHVRDTYRRFLLWTILAGVPTTFISSAEVRAQAMQPMSGMDVTLNHGPIPEIKWPSMKMEFAVAFQWTFRR
jgi:Cu/Ag efflux protein CusF